MNSISRVGLGNGQPTLVTVVKDYHKALERMEIARQTLTRSKSAPTILANPEENSPPRSLRKFTHESNFDQEECNTLWAVQHSLIYGHPQLGVSAHPELADQVVADKSPFQ